MRDIGRRIENVEKKLNISEKPITLYHLDIKRHGFEYLDWWFEGGDLVAVSRTAYDDGAGGAHNQHDANYLTFHRIRNFRELTMVDSVERAVFIGKSWDE